MGYGYREGVIPEVIREKRGLLEHEGYTMVQYEELDAEGIFVFTLGFKAEIRENEYDAKVYDVINPEGTVIGRFGTQVISQRGYQSNYCVVVKKRNSGKPLVINIGDNRLEYTES